MMNMRTPAEKQAFLDKVELQNIREAKMSFRALLFRLRRESLKPLCGGPVGRPTKPFVQVHPSGHVRVYANETVGRIALTGGTKNVFYRPPFFEGRLADYWSQLYKEKSHGEDIH